MTGQKNETIRVVINMKKSPSQTNDRSLEKPQMTNEWHIKQDQYFEYMRKKRRRESEKVEGEKKPKPQIQIHRTREKTNTKKTTTNKKFKSDKKETRGPTPHPQTECVKIITAQKRIKDSHL